MAIKTKKNTDSRYTQMIYKRWRNERIKLVMVIVPVKGTDQKRATCLFEGNTYSVIGKTHTEALSLLMSEIIKKAKLDTENNA